MTHHFFVCFTTPKPFGHMTIMRGNTYYFRALQNWEYIGCVQGVTNLQCAKHIQDTLNKVHLLGKSRKIKTSLGKRKFKYISSIPPSKKTQILLMQRAYVFSSTLIYFVEQVGSSTDRRQIRHKQLSTASPPITHNSSGNNKAAGPCITCLGALPRAPSSLKLQAGHQAAAPTVPGPHTFQAAFCHTSKIVASLHYVSDPTFTEASGDHFHSVQLILDQASVHSL